jgi:hypothetical protein
MLFSDILCSVTEYAKSWTKHFDVAVTLGGAQFECWMC